MAKSKAALPQGTRDFGPDVVRKRNFILDTIREVFELYGYQPLETPAMENLETLMGKYGEEGNKLIFRILNNGLDNPQKEKQARADFEELLKGKNVTGITERALKYDLTIPFARYVAMNHQQLTFPFKRYQVQPVWRADRPAKGRYREFYQCDADVVGSNSLLNEIELATIYTDVFTRLGLKDAGIRINHRKILAGLAETIGGLTSMLDISAAIDKLDKTGIEKVLESLQQKGLQKEQVTIVDKYLRVSGTNEVKLSALEKLLENSKSAKAGIEDIRTVLQRLDNASVKCSFDPSLARGLNYYTGIIFEAKAPENIAIGSIGGGGRYDDLTGLFGVPGIPGVGISFGVDRIYDVLEELQLFPATVNISSEVLFFNLGVKEGMQSFDLLQQLHHAGIRAELYPENIKMDKQFKYAEKKNIPYVVIIGEKELAEKSCNIKRLSTGVQEKVGWEELVQYKFK
jgi:histidyl-tRNA synthetase